MDYSYQREKNWDVTRREVMKKRLTGFKKDMELADKIRFDISSLRDEMTLVSSVMGEGEPVQGGHVSRDDRLNKILDEISRLEVLLIRIELDNRALVRAIDEIPDEVMRDIVKLVWIEGTESMRSLADKYFLSKSSVWRRSDAALLFLHDRLENRVGPDVFPK